MRKILLPKSETLGLNLQHPEKRFCGYGKFITWATKSWRVRPCVDEIECNGTLFEHPWKNRALIVSEVHLSAQVIMRRVKTKSMFSAIRSEHELEWIQTRLSERKNKFSMNKIMLRFKSICEVSTHFRTNVPQMSHTLSAWFQTKTNVWKHVFKFHRSICWRNILRFRIETCLNLTSNLSIFIETHGQVSSLNYKIVWVNGFIKTE